jgi:hypothetical protein
MMGEAQLHLTIIPQRFTIVFAETSAAQGDSYCDRLTKNATHYVVSDARW